MIMKNANEGEAPTPEFSSPLKLVELEAGERRELRLEAGETARRALARRFGLECLDRLDARLTVWPIRDGVAIRGSFDAEGVQACVVSFAPVPFRMEGEPIRLHLLREDALRRHEEEQGEAIFEEEIDHDLLEGGEIDLGEIVAQSLALALEPYPRAESEAGETLARLGFGLGDGERADAAPIPTGDENHPARRSPLRALGELLDESSGGENVGGTDESGAGEG